MRSLRIATVQDAYAIATVHVRAWQYGYRDQMPADYLDSLSVGKRARMWVEILLNERDAARTWLGMWGSDAVGFVSAGPCRDTDLEPGSGEVYALYVLPTSWNTGLAPNLLHAAEQFLASRGYREATLWVLDSNARARHFYEREGWHADGSEREDELEGFTLRELRYRRALTNEA